MNDREIMENMLLLEKGVCDLFMHGTIESASTDVHQTFNTSLNAALHLQDQIYTKMAQKGWYPMEQAPQSKINEEDAGILTDSEDDNAVMRNFTRQMLKDFIRE